MTEEQQRYSDYGTPQQANLLNRTILGDERGGRKKAYVKTNMDILYEETMGDDDMEFTRMHIDAGLTYMGWRSVARKAMGYGEGVAYGDSTFNEDDAPPEPLHETEEGEIEERFIILTGILERGHQDIVNACCEDADPKTPLLIMQVFRGNVLPCINAFNELDKKIHMARRIFEERKKKAEEALNKALDQPYEKA